MDPIFLSVLPDETRKRTTVELAADYVCYLEITRLKEHEDVERIYDSPDKEYRDVIDRHPELVRYAIDKYWSAKSYMGPERRQTRPRPPGDVYALECKMIRDETSEPDYVAMHDVMYITPDEMAYSLYNGIMPHRMLFPVVPDIEAERRFARVPRGPAWQIDQFSTFEELFQKVRVDFTADIHRAKQKMAFMLSSHKSTSVNLPEDIVRQVVNSM